MTSKAKHSALVLGGAVALAFGAYALGSQTGGGNASATAAKSSGSTRTVATMAGRPGFRSEGFGRDHGPGLDALATKLGVSSSALETALRQIKNEMPRPAFDRGQMLSDLATALGVSEAKLQAALDTVRPERGERHRGEDVATALASKLGIDAAKVRAAFDKLRAQGGPGPGGKSDLANALGVSQAKLQQAFDALKQDFEKHHTEREGARAAALAKALGLSTAKVQAALDKLEHKHQDEFAKLRDQFASKLAAKLNLDVSKVKSALEEFGPHSHP